MTKKELTMTKKQSIIIVNSFLTIVAGVSAIVLFKYPHSNLIPGLMTFTIFLSGFLSIQLNNSNSINFLGWGAAYLTIGLGLSVALPYQNLKAIPYTHEKAVVTNIIFSKDDCVAEVSYPVNGNAVMDTIKALSYTKIGDTLNVKFKYYKNSIEYKSITKEARK